MPLILPARTLDTASYEISNSLRFNDGDSPYLNKTPSSASNRRTFTISTINLNLTCNLYWYYLIILEVEGMGDFHQHLEEQYLTKFWRSPNLHQYFVESYQNTKSVEKSTK